jgi:tetratricopeptide (TPR) repeat protein
MLERLEDIVPGILVAEKCYLLSLCYLKTMDHKDLVKSREILSGWDEFLLSETEIWLRLNTTLMSVYACLYDMDSAKKIERSIMKCLQERTSYDSSTGYYINIIRRKASSLYISEVACNRTAKSIEYFSAMDDQMKFVYPLQYYYSINNHAANLITSGDFIEAFKFSKEALSVPNRIDNVHFPEYEIPSSNYIVSGLLSQNFSNQEALQLFKEVYNKNGTTADTILIANNYGVIEILNGNLNTAYILFKELYDSIKDSNIDCYYKYFIGSNLALLRHSLGDKEQALTEWAMLSQLIPPIPDQVFLKRRHDILLQALSDIPSNSWELIDSFITDNYPKELGRQWAYFGRGFLFSDIQIWYES